MTKLTNNQLLLFAFLVLSGIVSCNYSSSEQVANKKFTTSTDTSADTLWNTCSPLAKQFHSMMAENFALTDESVTAVYKLFEQSRYLGIEITGIDTIHEINKQQEVILIDAAINLLYTAAYGKDIPFRYNAINTDADSGFIIRQFASLLIHHNYQLCLDSLEPKLHDYKILKAKLKDLIAVQPNGSTNAEIAQVKESLNAWRWTQRIKDRDFVLVNIPSANLHLLTGDTVDTVMKVIIGKPSTPTPVFTSYINKVIVYPYWTVPRSIATKEMLPKIKQNINYLEKNNLQVIDNKGKITDASKLNWWKFSVNYFPYILRQSTGCDNSLGLLKFEFGSPYGIYLHDTNEKELFERKKRFLSHGCIRVEWPLEVAAHILGAGTELHMVDSLYHCEGNQQPVHISLKKQVPLLVLYLTAGVNENDSVVFYQDIYKRHSPIYFNNADEAR